MGYWKGLASVQGFGEGLRNLVEWKQVDTFKW